MLLHPEHSFPENSIPEHSIIPPLPPPQGKLYTEDMLQRRGVNWTSVRPVYIYVSALPAYCHLHSAWLASVAVGLQLPLAAAGKFAPGVRQLKGVQRWGRRRRRWRRCARPCAASLQTLSHSTPHHLPHSQPTTVVSFQA